MNAGKLNRVFQINAGFTVSLSGLTISDGSANGNGGGILNNGALTVAGCHITGCTASGFGGGIQNTGALTLAGSTVSNNRLVARVKARQFEGFTQRWRDQKVSKTQNFAQF